jgi:hypothetical protein
VTALTLLAFDRGSGQRHRLARRLRPDRRSTELLVAGPSEAKALLRRLDRMRTARPSAAWTACRDVSEPVVRLAWVVAQRGRLRRVLDRYLREWTMIRADIDGSDLLAKGVPQGPAVARGLRAALRGKLDGRAVGREAQLVLALRATGHGSRRRSGTA